MLQVFFTKYNSEGELYFTIGAVALLAALVFAWRADRKRAKSRGTAAPRGGIPSPSMKSQWASWTSCICFLVGYLTGLALVVWFSRPGGRMALLREAFWEGGWLAYVFLPLFWGTLIGWAVTRVALFVGTVVRITLVEFDPETQRIKEAATQNAAGGGAQEASREGHESAQFSESIAATDRALMLPRGGQQDVSQRFGEPN